MAADPLAPSDTAAADPAPVPVDDLPGTADDTAPADALSENFDALRNPASAPGAGGVAAGDGGAATTSQKLGSTLQKS